MIIYSRSTQLKNIFTFALGGGAYIFFFEINILSKQGKKCLEVEI